MVVPLVVDGERLDPGADRVVGKQVEFRRPVWVHGPMGLEVAAYPLEEVIARRTLGDFHAVVETSQAHAALHHLVEGFQVFVQEVSPTTIAIHHNGHGPIEHAGILGIAVVRDDDRFQTNLGFVQMLGQQLAPGNVLVRKVPMALGPGHEHNLFVFGESPAKHAQGSRNQCYFLFHKCSDGLDKEERFASWQEGESQRNRKLGRVRKPWQTKSRAFGDSVFGLRYPLLSAYPIVPYAQIPSGSIRGRHRWRHNRVGPLRRPGPRENGLASGPARAKSRQFGVRLVGIGRIRRGHRSGCLRLRGRTSLDGKSGAFIRAFERSLPRGRWKRSLAR